MDVTIPILSPEQRLLDVIDTTKRLRYLRTLTARLDWRANAGELTLTHSMTLSPDGSFVPGPCMVGARYPTHQATSTFQSLVGRNLHLTGVQRALWPEP